MKSQQKRCELLTVLSSFDDLLSNNRPLSPRTWHDSLAESIRDPEILLAKLGLPPEYLPPARAAAQLFALRVPLSFVARMQAGDPNDPLLRQVLPIQHELQATAGFTTLNQTVLLRGINDCVETLENLSERLIDTGVIPYYLHQLDRVDGAAHFEVNTAKGCELIKQLQKRLPGYAVPRYVQEIAGAAHKIGVEAD